MLFIILWIFVWLPISSPAAGSDRIRLIVETDAGGDPDDEQSMVRFLLYANEWDIEAIICNRPIARPGENRNRERTGHEIVLALVNAYAECWPQLVLHDSRYPKGETLLACTIAGYDDRDHAVNRIIAAVDRDDPRPVWYTDWGSDHGSSTNNMRRALDRVLQERGSEGYARFKEKLRIIGHSDLLAEHTGREPAWNLWVNTWEPALNNARWYHRFSALTATAGGFDIRSDCLAGHGPLGALYPVNTTHPQKEGDSMSFLFLVPTGMNDPEEPSWGSWAGRYGTAKKTGVKHYYAAIEEDLWEGKTNRDNTLRRWAAHLQNDFRARLDWCVQPFEKANHPPRVVLNGSLGSEIVRLRTSPGETMQLRATGSTDPDDDALLMRWYRYAEADSFSGQVTIDHPAAETVSIAVPEDAAESTIHIILEVSDNGSPPLTRYRRAVLDIRAEECARGSESK